MDSSNTSGPTADGSDPQTRGISGEMPTQNHSGHFNRDANRSKPGDRVGPYTLLELIGEGGFGTVWLAERREPMVQRVAIKIIKPGMDSKAVVARFDQERQALAVMDHPNVAKVFDGGVTDRGLPYFVMEYVKGEPITNFCDRHRYTIRQRLELFVSVCDAVQHAHMKGIIHRDLKPSNVLAEMVDGKPLVKVIDFGIAKALVRDEEVTQFTSDGMVIGTPEYMSPEQAGGQLDVDTRTDVYALGIVLYELLVGRLPFDPTELRRRGFDEIRRIIREEDPPKPSTRLSTIGAEGSSIALSRRHHSPSTLIRELRRELEWIPLKAMRKDRDRRYESAAAFGEDVRRYLDGRALRAAPESRVYLAKKFVARNKPQVLAAAAVFVALVAGLAVSLWQRSQAIAARDSEAKQRAEAEQQRAEALAQRARADERAIAAEAAERAEKERADQLKKVSDFQSGMLGQIDTKSAGAGLMADMRERFAAALEKAGVSEAERTARIDTLRQELVRVNATDIAAAMIDRTILKPAIKAIDAQFKDDPATDASLRQALATLYYERLALYDAAFPLQESSLATRRRVLGEEHPDTLLSANNMGYLLRNRGSLAEAEPYYREALEQRRRVLGELHPQTLLSINNIGTLLMDQGKIDQAEPYLREALDKCRHVLGSEHPDTIRSISNIGSLLQAQGKLGEAEPYLREALGKYRRVLGEEHPSTLTSINNIGTLLQAQGKLTEAEPYIREALEKSRRVLGEEHPDTLAQISNMGFLLHAQGNLDQAEPYFREALAKRRRVLGEEHPDTLSSINNMGALLEEQSNLIEAEPYFRETIEKFRRVLGEEHPDTLSSINNMGVFFWAQGKLAEAEPYLREAMEKRRRVLGEEHPNTLLSIHNMAFLLRARGNFAEAEPYSREAVEKSRRVLGEEHPNTLISATSLGILLGKLGRYEEVIDLLVPVEAAARQQFPSASVQRLADILITLGRARIGLGYDAQRFALAEANLLEAHPIYLAAKDRGPTHKDTLECVQGLVDLYTAWHAAEPGKVYDAKAAEWKAKLPAAAPAVPQGEATPK
jgi:serine/threonine protein kinase/Tfp pilus assembly protein PilF